MSVHTDCPHRPLLSSSFSVFSLIVSLFTPVLDPRLPTSITMSDSNAARRINIISTWRTHFEHRRLISAGSRPLPTTAVVTVAFWRCHCMYLLAEADKRHQANTVPLPTFRAFAEERQWGAHVEAGATSQRDIDVKQMREYFVCQRIEQVNREAAERRRLRLAAQSASAGDAAGTVAGARAAASSDAAAADTSDAVANDESDSALAAAAGLVAETDDSGDTAVTHARFTLQLGSDDDDDGGDDGNDSSGDDDDDGDDDDAIAGDAAAASAADAVGGRSEQALRAAAAQRLSAAAGASRAVSASSHKKKPRHYKAGRKKRSGSPKVRGAAKQARGVRQSVSESGRSYVSGGRKPIRRLVHPITGITALSHAASSPFDDAFRAASFGSGQTSALVVSPGGVAVALSSVVAPPPPVGAAFEPRPLPAALAPFVLYHLPAPVDPASDPAEHEVYIAPAGFSLPDGACRLVYGVADYVWDCDCGACVSAPVELARRHDIPVLISPFICPADTPRFRCGCSNGSCAEVCAGCAWLNSQTLTARSGGCPLAYTGAPPSWLLDEFDRPVLPPYEVTTLATSAGFTRAHASDPNKYVVVPFDLVATLVPASGAHAGAGEGVVYYVARTHWYVLGSLAGDGSLAYPKDLPGYCDTTIAPEHSFYNDHDFLLQMSRLLELRPRFLRKSVTCSLCAVHRCVWVCDHDDCHIGLCALCYSHARSPDEGSPNWPATLPDGSLPRPGTCSSLSAGLSRRFAQQLWAGGPTDRSLLVIPTALVHINGFHQQKSAQPGHDELRYQQACPGLLQGLGCFSLFPLRFGEVAGASLRQTRIAERARCLRQLRCSQLVIDLRCHSSTQGYHVGSDAYGAEQLLTEFIQPLVDAFHAQLSARGMTSPTPAGRVQFSQRVLVVLSTCLAVASTWRGLLAASLTAGRVGYQLVVTGQLLPMILIDTVLPDVLPLWLNARKQGSLADLLGYALPAHFINVYKPTVITPALADGALVVQAVPVVSSPLPPLATRASSACSLASGSASGVSTPVDSASLASATAAVAVVANTLGARPPSPSAGTAASLPSAPALAALAAASHSLQLSSPVNALRLAPAALLPPFGSRLTRHSLSTAIIAAMPPLQAAHLLAQDHVTMIHRLNGILDASFLGAYGVVMTDAQRADLLFDASGGSGGGINSRLRLALVARRATLETQ